MLWRFLPLCLLASAAAHAATVTVDPDRRDQTIEGFGTFGAASVQWHPEITAPLANRLVNDLGETISRGPLPFDFEKTDVTGSWRGGDFSPYNLNGDVSKWIPIWKTLHQAGVSKFIISCWTPPVWMKTPGNHGHKEPWCQDGRAGGRLLPANYEKFADMCVAFVKYFQARVGVAPYALSIQNEPAFDEPYESCVYTPEEWVALLKVVGAEFQRERLTTKLFGPEDIGWYDRVMKFINGATSGPGAPYGLGIVAVHGYANNGITPDSPDAKVWEGMHAPGARYGRELWMTETSGYKSDFPAAMALARAIYTALRYGHVSAWLWWQAANGDKPMPGGEELLGGVNGDGLPSKYYVSKNFYHYIRPGAVRVDAGSDDRDVLPLAFLSKGYCVLVLINNSTAQKTVALKGGIPGQYFVYRTSQTENCAPAGTASASAIQLPAQSVTTLLGTSQY